MSENMGRHCGNCVINFLSTRHYKKHYRTARLEEFHVPDTLGELVHANMGLEPYHPGKGWCV